MNVLETHHLTWMHHVQIELFYVDLQQKSCVHRRLLVHLNVSFLFSNTIIMFLRTPLVFTTWCPLECNTSLHQQLDFVYTVTSNMPRISVSVYQLFTDFVWLQVIPVFRIETSERSIFWFLESSMKAGWFFFFTTIRFSIGRKKKKNPHFSDVLLTCYRTNHS